MFDFKPFYLSILLREDDGTFPVRTCSNSVWVSCQSLVVRKLNLILIGFTCKIFIQVYTPNTNSIVLMTI